MVRNFTGRSDKDCADAPSVSAMMEFNPDRKFPWTIEQVEAVASLFFEKAPGKISTRDKWAWAAQEAVNYLNARRNACDRALERNRAISNHYEKVRSLAKEREKLAEEWPYEKAVKYITGEPVWDRALKKFNNSPSIFPRAIQNGQRKSWKGSATRRRSRGPT